MGCAPRTSGQGRPVQAVVRRCKYVREIYDSTRWVINRLINQGCIFVSRQILEGSIILYRLSFKGAPFSEGAFGRSPWDRSCRLTGAGPRIPACGGGPAIWLPFVCRLPGVCASGGLAACIASADDGLWIQENCKAGREPHEEEGRDTDSNKGLVGSHLDSAGIAQSLWTCR